VSELQPSPPMQHVHADVLVTTHRTEMETYNFTLYSKNCSHFS